MRRGKVGRALLARIARYARPYVKWHAIILATIVALAFLSIVPPLLIRDLIDVAIPAESLRRVTLLGLAMVAVPLLTGILEVTQRWATAWVGESVVFDLRRALVQHLHGMPLEFYVGSRTGELMARLSNDVVGAQQALAGSLVTMTSGVVTVSFTLAAMLAVDWRLTGLALVVLPVFYFASRLAGRSLRTVVRLQMGRTAAMSGIVNEALNVSGALLVKLFGRADDENARFAEEAAALRELGVRRAVLTAWLLLAFSLAGVVGGAVVFGVGALLVINGGIDVGDVIALSLLLGNLYKPLSWLATAPIEFATSVVSFERVFEVLDLPPAIADRPGAVDLLRVEGRVEFRSVGFRYEKARGLAPARRYSWGVGIQQGDDAEPKSGTEVADATLEDVSFVAEPGTLVALVGPSGAGKTTIGYLVPRLLEATTGTVLIDGCDVRDLTRECLTRTVGMVTQEPHLLHDTVAANLRYARPAATQEQLEAACRATKIHDVIAGLPAAYDTVVGERGHRLSGGERQRLSIARVILEDPRIVILDEATSHLDAASETLVQAALEALWRDRTSLVIAHRLATIAAADQILVVDEGRIVERGTHAELAAAGGVYASLYKTQFTPSPTGGRP